jgi:4-hydroxyphenylpyruvate dioxygenase-like putative hemolysin
LPQTKLIQTASIAVVIISVYMIGAISNNDAWLSRVKDLEVKVAEAEAKSATVNTEIVTKVLTKTQVVRERGETVVKYIDRETIKIDERCTIPPEFVEAHNKAATK